MDQLPSSSGAGLLPYQQVPSGPHDLSVGLELLQHKVAMSQRRGREKLQAQVPAVISVPWIQGNQWD